jgi:hypothetical protein
MEFISPINTETCASYYGKPVCAVLHDGSRVYGYLNKVENGQLLLSHQPTLTGATSQLKKSKKAQTSAVYPYPPYGHFPGGILALELALIALLFAVPFFW